MGISALFRKAARLKSNGNPISSSTGTSQNPTISHGDRASDAHLSQKEQTTNSNPRRKSVEPVTIQLYSHNIRCDTWNLKRNEESWAKRRARVIDCITHCSAHLPTIVGLQEVKKNQLDDIIQGLGSGWDYFGVGRDDGIDKGEFAPIFYKSSEWQLVSGTTYWLSETPAKPSKGWDAALPRIVTSIIVKHKQLGREIKCMNTHYDHKGKEARNNSSRMIKELASDHSHVCCVLGDFNAEPDHVAYLILASGNLLDTATNCFKRDGFQYTFSGFSKEESESTIDYIWVTLPARILKFHVMNNEFNDRNFSDHRPLSTIIQI